MTTHPLHLRSHHKPVRGPGGQEGAETTADDFLRDHEPLGRDPGGKQERGNHRGFPKRRGETNNLVCMAGTTHRCSPGRGCAEQARAGQWKPTAPQAQAIDEEPGGKDVEAG